MTAKHIFIATLASLAFATASKAQELPAELHGTYAAVGYEHHCYLRIDGEA